MPMGPPTSRPTLVVLDRDGVVSVERAGWISDPADLEFETNAVAGATRLADAGVRLAIATNQSGIGRGAVTAAAVAAVNESMRRAFADAGVALGGVYVCPHTDEDACSCRKPQPGLVLEAIEAAGTDPDQTWLVGDMDRDLLAGRAAGVHVALVRTGKGRTTERTLADDTPVFDDLTEFADWLLGGPA